MDYSHNCGGYALGTKNWFIPYDERRTHINYGNGECLRNLDNFVKFMLEIFENVRIINDIEEVEKNERVVAFRCGLSDFHFVKISKQKRVFMHKAGSWNIERMKKEDFFDEKGWANGKYNSEIRYLAIKGNKAKYNEKGREIFL